MEWIVIFVELSCPHLSFDLSLHRSLTSGNGGGGGGCGGSGGGGEGSPGQDDTACHERQSASSELIITAVIPLSIIVVLMFIMFIINH